MFEEIPLQKTHPLVIPIIILPELYTSWEHQLVLTSNLIKSFKLIRNYESVKTRQIFQCVYYFSKMFLHLMYLCS